MKKTPKPSQSSRQINLIDPPVALDLTNSFAESKLSKNESGFLKRRLIEGRGQFGKWLQWLVRQAQQQATTPLDMPESLKQLEEKEGREVRSFDSVAKVLSRDFPQVLQLILDEYQIQAEKTQALIGKEFIAIKRIADVIYEAKGKTGREFIIQLEFETEYKSDEYMDKRKLHYRHMMEMDEDFQGKVVLSNVFYLRGSPAEKPMIEDRTVKLPTTDPRYSGELKYKAYHLSLMTIETMIKRKLPFLLPFFVKSELKSLDEASTRAATDHIQYLRQQIDEHEVELTEMIEALTDEQLETLRTTVDILWGKSYTNEVFNKSTLLTLMREQLNFRQKDIQWGRREGIAKRAAKEMSVFQLMLQEGKLTREQLDYFLKRMEEEDEKKRSEANLNEQ
jgi:hypothetical protein